MIEMTVVVTIAAILVSMAGGAYSMYRERSSARRAAQVFARDLMMARSTALRVQERVTVVFYESSQRYQLRTESGRQLIDRRFGSRFDVFLSAIDLALPGDSLTFSTRGAGNVTGVGTATFRAGTTTYQVRFNSMGAARVAQL
jgi:type II secretory pathway pseudopilin PulG